MTTGKRTTESPATSSREETTMATRICTGLVGKIVLATVLALVFSVAAGFADAEILQAVVRIKY
jgi:hypothetical protein